MPSKLGQNFLRDEAVVKKIIQAAALNSDSVVLEIGPGEGVLTEKLAQVAGEVLAVELDKKLVENLENKFVKNKKIKVLKGDVLDVLNPKSSSMVASVWRGKIQEKEYKVVANIPYYITSSIVRSLLEYPQAPKEIILMMQKEVAKRITAKIGKMSLLAVSVRYYAEAKLLFSVPRTAFYPIPEVDSAVLGIFNIQKRDPEERKKFFQTVRAGFCAKRKTLANNLANSFHLDKKATEKKIISLGFQPMIRAQELSIDDWKKLAEKFQMS